jgi:hypothetical protein
MDLGRAGNAHECAEVGCALGALQEADRRQIHARTVGKSELRKAGLPAAAPKSLAKPPHLLLDLNVARALHEHDIFALALQNDNGVNTKTHVCARGTRFVGVFGGARCVGA